MHGDHARGGFSRRISLTVATLAMALATPALAHHPMGGKTPATFMEGLLSGIGHPVIGPDHLAFLIAIGLVAAMVPSGLGLIAAFVATSLAGVLVHAMALNLPLGEQVIAASVIAAGWLIAAGYANRQPVWLLLAAAAGLYHGYAFGEAVIGAERGVVGAYLAGLAVTMAALAGIVMVMASRMLDIVDARALPVRAMGLAVTAVGIGAMAYSLI